MKQKFLIFSLFPLFVGMPAMAERGCDSGFDQSTTIHSDTFVKPTGGTCPAGYSLGELPDTMYALVNGYLLGNEIKLCNNGYSTNGTSCKTYSQGSCDSGYNYISAQTETFVHPVNSACDSGYVYDDVPSTMYPLYNGYIVGDEIKLCNNGFSTNNSSCTTYTSGNCDSGYYDMALNSGTFDDLSNGTCSSPYSLYTGTTRCDRNPGDTCVDVPTQTVTLNFSDGNGNTTTNTCVYDENITLPATPTRPGYTFNGWVVSQN